MGPREVDVRVSLNLDEARRLLYDTIEYDMTHDR